MNNQNEYYYDFYVFLSVADEDIIGSDFNGYFSFESDLIYGMNKIFYNFHFRHLEQIKNYFEDDEFYTRYDFCNYISHIKIVKYLLDKENPECEVGLLAKVYNLIPRFDKGSIYYVDYFSAKNIYKNLDFIINDNF